VTPTTERKLDPETVCTRLVARLIEDVACVDIAPDSPIWTDLGSTRQRVGELRVYRGRGRVQKIVSSCYRLSSPSVDSHRIVVFTHPESPVPHLVLDAVQEGARIAIHVDLIPKRDLAIAFGYVDLCYAPLSSVRAEIDADTRFSPDPLPLRQRPLFSAWAALFSVLPADLRAAQQAIEPYINQWAQLLRSEAPELASAPDVATRDAVHRRFWFSRTGDPTFATLEREIGTPSVERILAALSA
jgi:hypothetical protein